MKITKEQPQNEERTPAEIEKIKFEEISELLKFTDEETAALNQAMSLVEEGKAKIEIKKDNGKRELIIRSTKDGSVLFYNDFGLEEHDQQIEEEIRKKLYN